MCARPPHGVKGKARRAALRGPKRARGKPVTESVGFFLHDDAGVRAAAASGLALHQCGALPFRQR